MKLKLFFVLLTVALGHFPAPAQLLSDTEPTRLRQSYDPDSQRVTLEWDNGRGLILQYSSQLEGPWKTVAGAQSPYLTSPVKEHRYYRLQTGTQTAEGGQPNPGVPGDFEGQDIPSQETFCARAESNMGVWKFLPDSDWMFTRGTVWTRIRSNQVRTQPTFRSMSGNFLVERDNTPVAVFFSAEAYVEPAGKRMFVRAKVDGNVLDPSDVVFTAAPPTPNAETRSFIFTTPLDKGLHTLEMEWMVDENATGYIRDAAFVIRQGESGGGVHRSFIINTPPSGPQEETFNPAWSNIPGLSGSVQTHAGDSLAISVSAESYTTGGGALFLRALVDGVPAEPSDVLFAKGPKAQCRMMTFGLPKPAPGVHNVTLQWMVNGGGSALIGDRSLVLAATSSSSSTLAQVFKSVPSGGSDTTSTKSFEKIPGMQVSGHLPPNSEVAVLFSAETIVPDGERLFARLMIDGLLMSDPEVQLTDSHTHVGTHSHLFSIKHVLYPGPTPPTSAITVEWRTENGKTVSIGDRTMTVLVKPATVPDLAEPIPFGGGNAPIEASIGTRFVYTIFFDPGRPGIGKPHLANANAYLFGPMIGLKHYYDVVSAGKLQIQNPLGDQETLGWYDGTNDVTAYFDGGEGCPGSTPNGQDTRRLEAIRRAGQDFNFANYDFNKDGILDPYTELAILILMPDDGEADPAGKWRSVFDENCDRLTVNGVLVPYIAEWFTRMGNNEFTIAIHEAAHLLFNLDDTYVTDQVNTRQRRLSMLDISYDGVSPHIDPLNKLALGWVTPRIVENDGNYSLTDVKKNPEVIVLPRKPGKSTDEYYILENRQSAMNHTLYDREIQDSGIAVWHVVEGGIDGGIPPACQNPADWFAQIGDYNSRRGNRVVRPQIVADDENSLWDDTTYDLLDNGLLCPFLDGGNPANRRNVLRWADDVPSGYSIINWSPAAETMSFQIIAP